MDTLDFKLKYVERIRAVHLGLLFTSIVTLITLISDFNSNSLLFNELDVIDQFTDVAIEPFDFINDTLSEEVKSKHDVSHAKSLSLFQRFENSPLHEQLSRYQDSIHRDVWGTYYGKFKETLIFWEVFEDDPETGFNEWVSTPYQFLNVWDYFKSLEVFMLVTSINDEYFEVTEFERQSINNRCVSPKYTAKTFISDQKDTYGWEEFLLTTDFNVYLSLEPAIEGHCDFVESGIVDNLSLRVVKTLPLLETEMSDTTSELRLRSGQGEERFLYYLSLNTDEIEINLNDYWISSVISEDDINSLQIVADDFPELRKFLDENSNLDLVDTETQNFKDIAKKLQRAEVKAFVLFGVPVPHRFISPWGSLLINIFLLYLCVHIRQLDDMRGIYSRKVTLPWIGFYDSIVARIITYFTTILVPFLPTAISLYLAPRNNEVDYISLTFCTILSAFTLWFTLNTLWLMSSGISSIIDDQKCKNT